MTSTFYAAPAPAPAEIPGVSDGAFLGSIGAGGTALALIAILILGIKKGGRLLKPNGALILGFIASLFCVSAGGIWAYPSAFLRQILERFTGTGSILGDVGMGAIAIVVTAVVWYSDLNAKKSAIWGFIAAIVYGSAGGLWATPIEAIYTTFTAFGL